jgi:peptidoglycan/LPS O-acetylase OafA/YrhL|tara:strand:+ start:1803 stop:2864 length:1062 start_codon:yes stop_codon:yes gene_type:complete
MKRIASVELLRFISSFMILIWHYQHFFLPFNRFSSFDITDNIKHQPLFDSLSLLYEYGYIGVQIFFTISGFVFSYVYLQRTNTFFFKEFIVHRFARLYPLHFLTLVIVLFIQIYSLNKFGNYQINSINDAYHFFLNLFFISGWGFEKGYSFNGPIWSVSIELIIYGFFFLSLIRLNKNRFYQALIVFIILLILRKFNISTYMELPTLKLIIECSLFFYSGVLIYLFFKKFKNSHVQLILSIILIFFSFNGNFKIFLFCPSLLLLFLSFEKYLNNFFRKIFNTLGNLTYGMYLCHFPLQIICIMMLRNFSIDTDIYLTIEFLLLYLIFILATALLSFNFFEKKLNTFIKKKLLP